MRSQTVTKIPQELSYEIEDHWRRAVTYYQERGSVIFLSNSRFWESHGQPHRSLARLLSQRNVDCTWFDGSGWRNYQPKNPWPSPRLHVTQLAQLPGRRIPAVHRLSTALQARLVRRELARRAMARRGGRPVIWVVGGIDEELAERLPYIDVFSVFDDPYAHQASGALCSKARLVLTQNTFAKQWLEPGLKGKIHVAFPPVDMASEIFGADRPLLLPRQFPERRMGYIGSFFHDYFDLDLFEDFIRSFPDWGFLLMGRTDLAGQRKVERFRRYPNFWACPWVPRSQVLSAWKELDLCLLFYREQRSQDGAFPSKLLESLQFGVPCLATRLPKTDDLEGYFPRAGLADRLKQAVAEVADLEPSRMEAAYRHFSYEMSPKLHLARVADWLSTGSPSDTSPASGVLTP